MSKKNLSKGVGDLSFVTPSDINPEPAPPEPLENMGFFEVVNSPSERSKRSKFKLELVPFLLIIILISLGFIIGGNLFFSNKKSKEIPLTSNDITKQTKTFRSSKGYEFEYPNNLYLKPQIDGFYVFSSDPTDEGKVFFYLDERGLVSSSEIMQELDTKLTNSTFTPVEVDSIHGFIVSGQIASGQYVLGNYVKTAYITLEDMGIIFGCQGSHCKLNIFEDLVSSVRLFN